MRVALARLRETREAARFVAGPAPLDERVLPRDASGAAETGLRPLSAWFRGSGLC